ncbi:hypothetical protein [Brevibacterium sp. JSBI002]|uniref:hypothetical protein n=1 Tax=Brevibacterium sp. JSBI002 TaxID=2886045 RepID=UPI00222F754C|nr:hypothetical protein [Brevibacterium sp. JSBI002]UZD62018.1 hypothetical protein LJ362_15340 [Brevibacterium sp. JSBI002]
MSSSEPKPITEGPPTPAFVIDEEALEILVTRFQKALDRNWPNSVMSYSVKTNSLPWLLSYMKQRGIWAEVVSDSEYGLARVLGFPPERIVYNGPVKSRALLRSALREGSLTNLDSSREVRWAAELARERPDLNVRVGLRVNWDLEGLCPGESTVGDAASRFGFDFDNGDLSANIAQLTGAGAKVVGLHMHRNSRTSSPQVFQASAGVASEIISTLGLELDWLDIGGGFFGSLKDTELFDQYFSGIRSTLSDVVDPRRTRLVIEPGGSVIAAPVELHAQVLDVKDIGRQRFVITDTSRVDLDPLFRKTTPFDISAESADQTHPEQVLAGFTCMEDDRLMVLTDYPTLSEGDRIVFRKVGAYTMSYGSAFIEYPPAVYLRHEDGLLTLIRRRCDVEDYLQCNGWSHGPSTLSAGSATTAAS